jgi:3-hydroxyacyl-CoA dehydrogenase
MDRLVSVEHKGTAAILTMMNPPVNALSRQLAEALREVLNRTEAEKIVLTGSGKMFVAGADIREIERITRGEIAPDLSYLNDLLEIIERSGRLVVMAMNGGALGIGLELAMAGHYRVLDRKAVVGLPEVKLGLFPGAGGTQRLPRLAGVETALRMILSGEVLKADEALRLGIVDALSDGDVVERALQIEQGRRTDLMGCAHYAEWDRWSVRLRSQARAIEAIRAATLDFDEGLKIEARLFREALVDEQARAMVYLFFAERESGKVPGLPKAPHAEARCETRETPNGAVVEVMRQSTTSHEDLAATLEFVRKQGKLAVVCQGEWLGRERLDFETGKRLLAENRALRASDLDVLMVRGYGYPEELGGPMFRYSMTPSQTSESLREPLK